jgi:hypothetical protein
VGQPLRRRRRSPTDVARAVVAGGEVGAQRVGAHHPRLATPAPRSRGAPSTGDRCARHLRRSGGRSPRIRSRSDSIRLMYSSPRRRSSSHCCPPACQIESNSWINPFLAEGLMDLRPQPGMQTGEFSPCSGPPHAVRGSPVERSTPPATDPSATDRPTRWHHGCRSSPARSHGRRSPTDVPDAASPRTRRPSTSAAQYQPQVASIATSAMAPPAATISPARFAGCCRSDSTTPLPVGVQHDDDRPAPVQVEPTGYARIRVRPRR